MAATDKSSSLEVIQPNIVQRRTQMLQDGSAEFIMNDAYGDVRRENGGNIEGTAHKARLPSNAIKLPAVAAAGQEKARRRCSSPAKNLCADDKRSSVARRAQLFENEPGSNAAKPMPASAKPVMAGKSGHNVSKPLKSLNVYSVADSAKPKLTVNKPSPLVKPVLSPDKPTVSLNKPLLNPGSKPAVYLANKPCADTTNVKCVDVYAVVRKDKKPENKVIVNSPQDKSARPKVAPAKPLLNIVDHGACTRNRLDSEEVMKKKRVAPSPPVSPQPPPLPATPPPRLMPRPAKTRPKSPTTAPPSKPPRTFAHDAYKMMQYGGATAAVTKETENVYEEVGGNTVKDTMGHLYESIHSATSGDKGLGKSRHGVITRPTSRPPRPPLPPSLGTSARIDNPGYGHTKRDSDVIPMRRCQSDECLYAELRQAFAGEGYREPVDLLPASRSSDLESHITEHGVVVDTYGYAVPEVSLLRKNPVRKQISDQTVARLSPKRQQSTRLPLMRAPPPQSEVREQVSRAYSILRPRVSDGTDEEVDDADDSDTDADLEDQRRHVAHVSNVWKKYARHASSGASIPPRQLFSFAIIVRLKSDASPHDVCYKPSVLFTFPAQPEEQVSRISEFCFPNESLRRPLTEMRSETFSFVLTTERGERQYGYCRRILPPGSGPRLPEVFCVVSCLGGAWGLYSRLLIAAERKRAESLDHVQELLQAAYGRPLPAPGREAWVRVTVANQTKETVILKRPEGNTRENLSFGALLSLLSIENLISIFSSLLLERRIIFIARNLSSLTSCVDALVALLYPLSWPHTLVPIVPSTLLEVCCCPTPFIVGVLADQQMALLQLPMEKVLIVDLDSNLILKGTGDESTIIPRKLRKALTIAVKEDIPEMTTGAFTSCSKSVHNEMTTKDSIVFEAFLRFFVETIGHYTEFIGIQQDGEKIFQRDAFVRAVSSKSIRLFLEWFSQTQMFNMFISEQLTQQPAPAFLFEARILEYRDEMEVVHSSLKSNVKAVGKRMITFLLNSGDRIKKVFV